MKKRYKTMKAVKFAQIHVKFVRNSYQFRTNFTKPLYSQTFLHVKFVRISYTFHVNVTKYSHLVHGDGRNLPYNPPHFHRVCTTHHGAW